MLCEQAAIVVRSRLKTWCKWERKTLLESGSSPIVT